MVHVTGQRPLQGWFVICYDQSIYQAWSQYPHPLRRYERRYNNDESTVARSLKVTANSTIQ